LETEASLIIKLRELTNALAKTAMSLIPDRKVGCSGTDRKLADARERVDAAHHVRLQVAGIRAKYPNNVTIQRKMARSSAHRRAVGDLYELLGAMAMKHRPQHDDLGGLTSFLDHVEPLLVAAQTATYLGSDDARRDHQHMQTQFHRDPAAFLQDYVKEGAAQGASDAISSATDPDTGRRVSSAARVKQIVRYWVKKPLSTRVEKQTKLATVVASRPSLSSPFANLDARTTGKLAAWYNKMMDPQHKLDRGVGVTQDKWQPTIDPVTAPEFHASLTAANGGKSPGPDGISIDLLKLVCRQGDPRPGSPEATHPNACTQAVIQLLNGCLHMGYVPPALKEGWITLVPKPEKDGSWSTEPDRMRPITLLSEFSKMLSRIIAKRITRVLVQHPGLLSPQQRAFHMDGAVDQCTNVVVDVIEDWHQRKRDLGAKTAGDLFVVSYDQAKAYDKVQLFTIQDSMRRFNMPEILINYVVSSLTNATSKVRTAHGMTNSFDIRSGIRQGDPLSPVIYSLITDALHEGLLDNPLFPDTARAGGYTLRSHDYHTNNVRICSAGYADDTVIVATDPKRLGEMHAWVRAFFGAHSLSLNVDKTKLLCSDITRAPELMSVCGKLKITPMPADTVFRYLGLHLNLALDWSDQRERMNSRVQRVCTKIRTHRFTLDMTVYAVKQYLLPSLRLGLLTTDVPNTQLQKWDSDIRQAALMGAGMFASSSLARPAVPLGSGIPRLLTHTWELRAEEAQVTLLNEYPSSHTAWARANIQGLPLFPHSGRPAPPNPQLEGRAQRSSRLANHIFHLRKMGITIEYPPQCLRNPPMLVTTETTNKQEELDAGIAWRPQHMPVLFTGSEGRTEYVFYTDGSTGRDKSLMSGSAVVQMDAQGNVERSHRFPVRASGANYLAEMAAILAAILMAPTHANVTVHTDCRSALQAINRNRDRCWQEVGAPYGASYHLPQRRRVVMACRPVLNLIRRAIQDRKGTVTLVWIRAHTDGRDIHSRMNDIADREANRARIEAKQTWHRIAGYERLVMRVANTETIGSYRKQVQRYFTRSTLADLAKLSHQGGLARYNEGQLLEFCRVAQRANNSDLLRFTTELIAEWLPAEAVRTSNRADRGRGPACKLCGNAAETVRHAICDCPHELPNMARMTACARTAALLQEQLHFTTEPEPARPHQNGPGIQIPAFFDPSSRTLMEICPAVSGKIQDVLRNFDPLSGVVGLLPPGLDEVLCWVKTAKDSWSKLSLRDTCARMERIRASLLLGGLQIWTARCRAMDTWWKTQAPTKCVEAEAEVRLKREATRKTKAEAKHAAATAKARDKLAAKGQEKAATTAAAKGIVITEAMLAAAAVAKRLRSVPTRVRGSPVLATDAPGSPQLAPVPVRKLSRMEKGLQSFLTPGRREGPSTNLAGFRSQPRLTDHGPVITDNAFLAALLEEVERRDSVHNARKWVRLPWY
jgi:hypothetical protein